MYYLYDFRFNIKMKIKIKCYIQSRMKRLYRRPDIQRNQVCTFILSFCEPILLVRQFRLELKARITGPVIRTDKNLLYFTLLFHYIAGLNTSRLSFVMEVKVSCRFYSFFFRFSAILDIVYIHSSFVLYILTNFQNFFQKRH